MGKTLKKILCTLLVVVMCLTAAPLDGFVGMEWPKLPEINLGDFKLPEIDFSELFVSEAKAAEYTSGIYTYTLSGSNATITKCNSTVVGKLTIPATLDGYTVVGIGSSAFISMLNITSVVIPDSVKNIDYAAFYNCTSLVSVIIPEGVTTIGGDAFRNCTSLISVIIPDSVTKIGTFAFNNCTSLKSVTIGDSVTSSINNLFYNCVSLTSIIVGENNTTYSSDDRGVLFDKNKTLLMHYPAGNTNASYKIPDSVTTISSWAFHYCLSLTNVTIGDSVTTIDDYAFYDCTSLTNITIPNSVRTVGTYAFRNCTSLISVIIPDSVTKIGEGVFEKCTSLVSITVPDSLTTISGNAFYNCTNLTNITIPNNVTTINVLAFGCCTSLKSVTIPDCVSTINNYAFYLCENLTEVYYEGTQEQWNEISIYSYNECLTNATIHYNCVMPDSGENDNPTTPSENFKFEKESYTVKYNSLTDETTNSSITLTYKADISTIESFDDSMITFTVDDPSVFTFGTSLHIKPINPTDTITIYCTIKAKKLGTSTLTATLPDGTTASCKVTVEKYTDDVERFIQIRSTNKSLSTEVGDSFKMYFTLMEDGYEDQNWKKVSFAISDPTVISVKINGNAYGSIYDRYTFEVTGLKAGSTNVVVTDSDTGTYEIFTVNVYEPYTQRYNYYVEKWNGFYPDGLLNNKLKTYIYNMNGLYVNNYQWTKAGDKYHISFDVYNHRSHIGSVDVFDENGEWYDSYEIKKFKENPTNVAEWAEDVYFMVNDAVNKKWFTYEQDNVSEHTHLQIEVPVGGYFTISNNCIESIGVFFFNYSEILFEATKMIIEESVEIKADKFSKALKKKILDDTGLKKKFVKIFGETVSEIAGETLKDVAGVVKKTPGKILEDIVKTQIKDGFVQSTNLIEEILNEIKFDWKSVWKDTANIAQSGLEFITGSVGKTIDLMFSFADIANMSVQIFDMSTSMNAPFVTVHTLHNGEYVDKGVRVEDNGKIDSEAVLQVFKISNKDSIDVELEKEEYELYNICFVKDDKTVQPNGKVEVSVPITGNLKPGTCKIYRQEDDGSWTILDAYEKDGFLVFETDHFSLYAIVGEKQTISIATKPNKTTYLVNDVLDSTGLNLKVGNEIIDSGFICSPSVLSKNGKETITVTYMGLTAEFEVTVNASDEHKHNHKIVVVQMPNDAAKGYITYKCNCGHTFTIDFEHEHNYKKKYYPDELYTHITCSCGYSCIENGNSLCQPSKIQVVYPTCTSKGYTKYIMNCTCCEDYIANYVSATSHSFTNYISNNDATCTKDGTKTAWCRCGISDTIKDVGSAKGHSFTNYKSDKNGTCEKAGTKTAKCNNCSATSTITDNNSLGEHNYELIHSEEATCTKFGRYLYLCSICSASDVKITEATGHNYEKNAEICSSCGYNRGHNFEDNAEICSSCGYDRGHYFADGKSECSHCGYNKSDNCNCKCHKTGLITKLIWKFTLLFNKILRKNKVCACGIYHY